MKLNDDELELLSDYYILGYSSRPWDQAQYDKVIYRLVHYRLLKFPVFNHEPIIEAKEWQTLKGRWFVFHHKSHVIGVSSERISHECF